MKPAGTQHGPPSSGLKKRYLHGPEEFVADPHRIVRVLARNCYIRLALVPRVIDRELDARGALLRQLDRPLDVVWADLARLRGGDRRVQQVVFARVEAPALVARLDDVVQVLVVQDRLGPARRRPGLAGSVLMSDTHANQDEVDREGSHKSSH